VAATNAFSQKPHPLFHRDQDDIHFTLQLSLRESLCGWKRSVSTIDSKTIVIEKSNPTSPGSKDIYPGLGMPNSRKSGERGDFIVTYTVKYPASLTRQQKAKIEELFKPDLI
jgi:DnaJ homolog subfamily B member 4